jgi:phage recombination protein Bet
MNQIATQDTSRGSALALTEDELIPVLQSSLYPGAKPESIKLVLGYCRASGLDPMQKPVHIVPMLVKNGRKNDRGYEDKEWRDVIMPGIGLYRTQAARTGELAGIDEPDFGPDMQMPGRQATVPEWCRVTVYRMIGGQRVAFTAREYWFENYATSGKDSIAPNAMWERRPRGQIAKCAEAQALRKAFPELGSQPTADETIIEVGEVIDNGQPAPQQPEGFKVTRKPKAAPAAAAAPAPADDVIDMEPRPVDQPAPAPAAAPAAAPKAAKQPAAPAPDHAAQPGGEAIIGAGEIAYLQNKAKAIGVELAQILADMGGLVLEKLTKADFVQVRAHLLAMG